MGEVLSEEWKAGCALITQRTVVKISTLTLSVSAPKSELLSSNREGALGKRGRIYIYTD